MPNISQRQCTTNHSAKKTPAASRIRPSTSGRAFTRPSGGESNTREVTIRMRAAAPPKRVAARTRTCQSSCADT